MQTDNDNVPPDAFGTDWRAREMMVAVKELLDCPRKDFTPRIRLDAELAASALQALLIQLDQIEDKQ